MHSPIRTRHSARKATRIAQTGAFVLLVGGGVMAYTGLPGLEAPVPETGPLPEEDGIVPGESAEAGHFSDEYVPVIDPETIDGNLSLVSNCPVPPEEPVEDSEIEPVTETPVEGIRYVGSIKVGGRAAAFLNIGGVTKLLRPGGPSFEGVRLVRVDEDEVVISKDDGPEQTIKKSAREGSAVSVVTGGAPKPDKAGVVAADEPAAPPSFTPDMSREERRAAILERARNERNKWERNRGNGGGPVK